MKPLTKAVVNRRGGLATQFVPKDGPDDSREPATVDSAGAQRGSKSRKHRSEPASDRPEKADKPPPKPKFDRVTYQRELMRTRRAADKARKKEAEE